MSEFYKNGIDLITLATYGQRGKDFLLTSELCTNMFDYSCPWYKNNLINWLLCFEQVYNQLINLPNKGIFGGRFISFAPSLIDRSIS